LKRGNAAASTINTLQVLTNFEIGRRIVEHEQKGKKRADSGAYPLHRQERHRFSSKILRLAGISGHVLPMQRGFRQNWLRSECWYGRNGTDSKVLDNWAA
jgi:hypothetical protein